jgi:hypothetical protein
VYIQVYSRHVHGFGAIYVRRILNLLYLTLFLSRLVENIPGLAEGGYFNPVRLVLRLVFTEYYVSHG